MLLDKMLHRKNEKVISSRTSRNVSEMRSPSPCPFSHHPPSEQMEPFPEFEYDDENKSACDVDHCTLHCKHNVCQYLCKLEKKTNIEPKPCTQDCKNNAVSHAAVSIDRARIHSISRKNLAATKRAYLHVNKAATITVELRSATALIEKLRNQNLLDFRSHLHRHPHYTYSTLYKAAQYCHAARAADSLVDKIFDYFMFTLSYLPKYSRHMSIAELGKEMRDFMHLKVVLWASEWCLWNDLAEDDDELTRSSKLEAGVGHLLKRQSKDTVKEGVDAVINRVDELVERVMAVLVWWDGVGKGVEIEDAEFEGSDWSVESLVSDWYDDEFSDSKDSSHDDPE